MFSNLTESDLKFLEDLSQELNTQPNDGNASPVFWGIRDYISVRDDSDGEYSGVLEDGEEVFMEHWDNGIDKLKSYLYHYEEKTIIDGMDLNELLEICENFGKDENGDEVLTIFRYNRMPIISDMTGAFLTKEAAQKHLKENYYHYSKDAHTYAMTAWRNPEFEQLLNIIKKLT